MVGKFLRYLNSKKYINNQNENKIVNHTVVEYVIKSYGDTREKTNMRACKKYPNQLPRFGQMKMLQYSGAL